MRQCFGLDAVNTGHRHQVAAVALIDLERGQQVQGAGQVVGSRFEHHALQPAEVPAAQQWFDVMPLVQAQTKAQRHALIVVLLVVMSAPETQAIQAVPSGVLAAGAGVLRCRLAELGGDLREGAAVVVVRPAPQAAQQYRGQAGTADPGGRAPALTMVAGVQRHQVLVRNDHLAEQAIDEQRPRPALATGGLRAVLQGEALGHPLAMAAQLRLVGIQRAGEVETTQQFGVLVRVGAQQAVDKLLQAWLECCQFQGEAIGRIVLTGDLDVLQGQLLAGNLLPVTDQLVHRLAKALPPVSLLIALV
ncbi:hypothetical protein D3C79_625220 [compost metagenome]